jgi:hypothetical protein
MPIKLDQAAKDRLDALIPVTGRQDAVTANTSVFFARELESIESTIYEFKKRELKYREYIPVSNRDNPGAENITYHMFDQVGMAIVIANYANDVPRADVFGKEFTQKVKGLGLKVGYNIQEIRAATMANTPLETLKASAHRRGFREKESQIAWNGDSASGLVGLLDNPNLPTLAALAGVTTSTIPWATKNADEIITDIGLIVAKVKEQSKGIQVADTLLLPIPQLTRIATLPRSVNSDTTVLQFVLNNPEAFGITKIDSLSTELTNAFTGGTEDGAILYERTSENLELRIPLEMQLLPVEVKGFEFIINGESRIGGVVVRYPLAFVTLTGI